MKRQVAFTWLCLASFSLVLACDQVAKRADDKSDSPVSPGGNPTVGQGQSDPNQAGISAQIFDEAPLTNASISNLPQLVSALNLSRYHDQGYHCQNLRIAVLDNGFFGVKQSMGRYLPPTVQLFDAPGNRAQDTAHGTKLAEILYALCTGKNTYDASIPGPQLLLLNTNGFTNFVKAIDQVIALKADIVLYSQVWEYGGNATGGGGFVNREVNRALQQGILWINAAGNFGNTTYHAKTEFDETDSHVLLPYMNRYVRMEVTQDKTPVKVVLAWNDFAESKDYKTPQNLDLVLEDANHKEIGAGRLVQDGRDHSRDPDADRYSAHAREIVKVLLNRGTYYLRVDAKSRNFDHLSKFRIMADGEGVKFVDRTTDETVLMPADNPGVLTIGAVDVDYSASGIYKDGTVRKPELGTVSSISFADGNTFKGTSSAAAIAAGAIAVYSGHYGKLSKSIVDSLIENGTLAAESEQGSNSISVVCTGNNCSENTSGATPPVLRLP